MRYALTDAGGNLLGIIEPSGDDLANALIRGVRLELSVEYNKQTEDVSSFIVSPIQAQPKVVIHMD